MTAVRAFKNPHVSVSRLKRFEDCPQSFKLHYIDGLRSDPNDSLRFGTLLHTVLERVYRKVLEDEHVGFLDEKRVRALYKQEWARSGLSGIQRFEEGLAILEQYLRDNRHVDHRNILAVEQEFRLPVGGFEVLGYIDRVDKIDHETIEVIDYKSNRVLFDRDEVNSDLQLTVYHLAAKELWPWAKKVHLSFYMLRHGLKLETERTPAQLETAEEYVASLATQTETSKEYPARLNTNCPYCDHRQDCAEYQRAVEGKVEVVKASPDDLESVAREREQVSRLAKILYARRSELDGILKTKLKDEDSLELAGMVYRMSMATRVTYPVEPTIDILKEVSGVGEDDLRKRLLVVDKAKVDRLVKKLGDSMSRGAHRMLKTELDSVAKKSFSPRIYSKEAR